jgi:uncharacterized protein
MRLILSLFLSTACAHASPAVAEPKRSAPLVATPIRDDAEYARVIRAYYTKYEALVPMRDGVKLFSSFYVPKSEGSYPLLLTRTPYSVAPYGVDAYPAADGSRALRRFAPSTDVVRDGFILVHQDVRGRMMSEGTFVDVRPARTKSNEIDETTDAYDTIEWLVKNVPRNNGSVGTWGVSYPGFYAAQAAISGHPALKAASPQAPVTDWFAGDDFHHNGTFFLADAFDFYVNFGKPRPKPTTISSWGYAHDSADVYDYFLNQGTLAELSAKHMKDIPFWTDLMQHGTYDAFWQARNPRPAYRNVKPAVMTVGGWFDSEDLYGALGTYQAFETQSPGANNTLVMGPWRHGGWARTEGETLGDVAFGQKTSAYYREQVELPFFQRYLKGTTNAAPAEAHVFETGVNEWHALPSWPPKNAKLTALYFGAEGKLERTAPSCTSPANCLDTYVSDPAHPVPYRGRLSGQLDADYMSDDQRFASRRPDVLSYKTEPLLEDIRLAGPITCDLWVQVTGTDADFVVKLIDVYPETMADPEPNPTAIKLGGYQQLVRAEVMRGKFRNSLVAPVPFKPNEKTWVRVVLPDAMHAFRRGHRLMVQVQSTWFPLTDVNPQTFTDIYAAKRTDFHRETHSVLRAVGAASVIHLPLTQGALP